MIALRERYESLYGKRPFMGWSADVLNEKIAAFAPPPPAEPDEIAAEFVSEDDAADAADAADGED